MLLLGEEIQLTLWDCYTERVRELLYFPCLFQCVYTVFLTDCFILMVVLMVRVFLFPTKGCICTVVASDVKCDTQIGWLVFESIVGCSIFSETGHLKYPSEKNLGFR